MLLFQRTFIVSLHYSTEPLHQRRPSAGVVSLEWGATVPGTVLRLSLPVFQEIPNTET